MGEDVESPQAMRDSETRAIANLSTKILLCLTRRWVPGHASNKAACETRTVSPISLAGAPG